MLLGHHAYLSDVATVRTYRPRRYAAAIMRSLLDDALTAGTMACILASTAMAHSLYFRFALRDVMPISGFQPGKG